MPQLKVIALKYPLSYPTICETLKSIPVKLLFGKLQLKIKMIDYPSSFKDIIGTSYMVVPLIVCIFIFTKMPNRNVA